MININVDDYVRDKYGNIGRVKKINKSLKFDFNNPENGSLIEDILWLDTYYCFSDECDTMPIEDVVAYSPSIADLIQVGDYVNGLEVFNKENIEPNSIKRVLTREKVKKGEYNLEN